MLSKYIQSKETKTGYRSTMADERKRNLMQIVEIVIIKVANIFYKKQENQNDVFFAPKASSLNLVSRIYWKKREGWCISKGVVPLFSTKPL